MYYSLGERKMTVGKHQGEKKVVARLVTQSQRIDFDKFCQEMADGSTVSQADVAAVMYKLHSIIRKFCSYGYIVDIGPLGKFHPYIKSKSSANFEEFNTAEHILRASISFRPSKSFRELDGITFHKVAAKALKGTKMQESAQSSSTTAGQSQPIQSSGDISL